MQRPLIAIVGDGSQCQDPPLANSVSEQLGAELAKSNARLLVFSSIPQFIEYHAVCGYLKARGKRENGSVQVRYPPHLESLFPNEKLGDPVFIRSPQGTDWESSIYPSFAEIDGLILIGGQRTTKIYGLLALGSRTPLIALGGFGGAASDVLRHLRGDPYRLATDDDLRLMATAQWHPGSAGLLIASLLGQIKRKSERESQRLLGQSEAHRRRTLNLIALVGCALFIVVLVALAQSLGPHIPTFLRCLLFGVPALAGASGAAMRVLWDNWQQRDVPLDIRPVFMTIALGFWASGVAGALFVLPQLWVTGTPTVDQYTKLAGFAVPIGLIAGLTLDRVFPKLIKSDVPIYEVAGKSSVATASIAASNSSTDAKKSSRP